MPQTNFFVWLCPEQRSAAYLQALIEQLGRTWAGPVFAPHLTLGGGLCNDPAALQTHLERLGARHGPLRLSIEGLQTSPQRLKALHLSFEPSAALERLQVEVQRHVPGVTARPFRPHLSVLYKTLPATVRRELSESVRVEPADIVFDTIQLISAGTTRRQRTAVNGWRALLVVRLRSGA